MKRSFTFGSVLIAAGLLSLGAAPGSGTDEAGWRTARVTQVEVLESAPPQYVLTFEARCDDLVTEGVRQVSGAAGELVLGVIAKTGVSTRCVGEAPIVILKKITIPGLDRDPLAISILR